MPLKVDSFTPLLQVFDMRTSVAFYREILGFELVMQSQAGDEFDWCLLKLNESYLMLNTAYEKEFRPPRPEPARTVAHDDTGFFFNCPDVDAAYLHLQTIGIDAKPPKVAPYGMKQVYLKDPDGYVICLQHPTE